MILSIMRGRKKETVISSTAFKKHLLWTDHLLCIKRWSWGRLAMCLTPPRTSLTTEGGRREARCQVWAKWDAQLFSEASLPCAATLASPLHWILVTEIFNISGRGSPMALLSSDTSADENLRTQLVQYDDDVIGGLALCQAWCQCSCHRFTCWTKRVTDYVLTWIVQKI